MSGALWWAAVLALLAGAVAAGVRAYDRINGTPITERKRHARHGR